MLGNQCWQIVRTTDTGGVKLIYNGEAENNQCMSSRATHVGYAAREVQTMTGNFYYGTNYTYDNETGMFSLSGDII